MRERLRFRDACNVVWCARRVCKRITRTQELLALQVRLGALGLDLPLCLLCGRLRGCLLLFELGILFGVLLLELCVLATFRRERLSGFRDLRLRGCNLAVEAFRILGMHVVQLDSRQHDAVTGRILLCACNEVRA